MHRESIVRRVRFPRAALRASALPLVAVCLLGSAACSSSTKRHPMQPKVPETTSADAPSVRATGVEVATPGSLSTPPGPRPTYQRPSAALDTAAPTPTTAGLTDDQILQALHVSNTRERDAARHAEARGDDPRVKLFAGMLLREHGDADTEGFELARRLKLTLSDSVVSDEFTNDARVTDAQLRMLRGDDFDRTYIKGQVRDHQAVLDAIDNKLLPNAKSSEVRRFVEATRARMETRLREAESLQRSLEGKQ